MSIAFSKCRSYFSMQNACRSYYARMQPAYGMQDAAVCMRPAGSLRSLHAGRMHLYCEPALVKTDEYWVQCSVHTIQLGLCHVFCLKIRCRVSTWFHILHHRGGCIHSLFLRLSSDFGGVTPKLFSLKFAPPLIPNSGDATDKNISRRFRLSVGNCQVQKTRPTKHQVGSHCILATGYLALDE